MAIACLRLFTLPPRPPLPDLSLPRLRLRIAPSTSFDGLLEYFRLRFRAMRCSSHRYAAALANGAAVSHLTHLGFGRPGVGPLLPSRDCSAFAAHSSHALAIFSKASFCSPLSSLARCLHSSAYFRNRVGVCMKHPLYDGCPFHVRETRGSFAKFPSSITGTCSGICVR